MWVLLVLVLCESVISEYENVFTTQVNNTMLMEALPADFKTNITYKALKYGYYSEEHMIETEDGYLINIWRVRHPEIRTGKPVLVMHGIFDTSDTWFLRGRNSFGFLLADAGYDVWLGNCRGNRYGRHHVHMEPDRHAQFWNYSYHDVGYYDMAATVDYVLEETHEQSLRVIAQSQGTSVFYVLLSTKPEYNDKISVLVSLAPIAYIHNASGPFIPVIISLVSVFNGLLNLLGQHEIMADTSIMAVMMQYFCHNYPNLCARFLIFPLTGASSEQIEIEFYRYAIGRYPSASTRKNLLHLIQNRSQRRFAMYDYGLRRNMQVYGSVRSPSYDIESITTKVDLICSRNDGLSSLRDVSLLRKRLPNVVKYYVIPNAQWMHGDYLWGRGIKKVMMPPVLQMLQSA